MSVRPRFTNELSDKLQGKLVEVSLVGGDRTKVEGTLYAAQDDYVIVAVGDTLEGRFFIPTSGIAFIRLKTAANL